MNVRKMMKQAQQMQENLQRELAELSVEATAGGGMVTITMNGQKTVLGVKVDPEVVDPEDVGMLEDLILAAINEAAKKVDEHMQEKVGSMTGGIPGLF